MTLHKSPLLFLISLLYFVTLFISGCRNKRDHLKKAIEQVQNDYQIKNCAYLIAEDGKIIAEQSDDSELEISAQVVTSMINNFSAPLLLRQLIDKNVVKEKIKLKEVLRDSTKVDSIETSQFIAVPSNLNIAKLETIDGITATIEQVIRKSKRKKGNTGLNIFNTSLGIATEKGNQNLFKGLLTLSDFFDASHPEYGLRDTLVKNLFPIEYAQNLKYFFGWNVFRFQRQIVLWSCSKIGKKNILLMKFPDKRIFIALSYQSDHVTSSKDYGSNDLLQSPFAIAVIKTLFTKPQIKPDYNNIPGNIYKELVKGKKSNAYVLYVKELLAYARFYEHSGEKQKATALYGIYNRLMDNSLLTQYVNDSKIAETDYISNNLNAVVPFTIKDPSDIQIFAGGQVFQKNDYKDTPYQYDNIQFFFNTAAKQEEAKGEDTQVILFNYGSDKTYDTPGVWSTDSTKNHAFSDPDDGSYLLEVRIPWRKFKFDKRPVNRSAISVNIFVGDSDIEENQRKSILSWATTGTENFGDIKTFGKLIFSDKPGVDEKKKLYSCFVKTPPQIDGIVDPVWDKSNFSEISVPYQGNPSQLDNQAKFKSLYDDKYLYLLFHVVDNCKNKPGIVTKDKCWIENASNGEVVWKMNGRVTDYFPSFNVEKKIHLVAGNYLLRYTSDDKHSFTDWYGKPPVNAVYGAYLYKSH